MVDVVIYGVIPIVLFGSGYLVGFLMGKIKYSPNIPPPNYLGGSSSKGL